jgi:hypothetical protein
MAKQTFTTGQVLTAAQMTSLQQTAMGGGSATAKTASYTLVAADAGATVIMNSASATTITVNTSLFSAGDTVFIQNLGAGVSTITPGTATVNTASSLALAQYESGNLYFTAAGASIFSKADGAAAGGGKVLQVVSATTATSTSIITATYTDTTITATITPTSATSKILVLASSIAYLYRATGNEFGAGARLLRGATVLYTNQNSMGIGGENVGGKSLSNMNSWVYLDSPATTSATTYKIQAKTDGTAEVRFQVSSDTSVITLLEIGA